MRVLQFIASEGWGGAEKVVVELANQLAPRCELYALLLKDTVYVERFSSGVKVLTTTVSGSRRNIFLLYEIARILKRLQPDIVHTHAVKAAEMIYLLGRFSPIRQVATKHDARRAKIFNKLPYVTAVSKKAEQSINNNQGLVKVIHNGILPQTVANKDLPATFSMVAVGRLDDYKGFDILINEVAKLTFDFVLYIIGEGKERRKLENLIRKNRLEKKVFLLGHRENIPELLAGAHLQVISSRIEGFSLVAIEGLLYANLLIATRVGIADEILSEDLLINHFDIAGKINEVYQSYDICSERFKQIKNRQGREFLLPEIAEKYLAFYEQVLA